MIQICRIGDDGDDSDGEDDGDDGDDDLMMVMTMMGKKLTLSGRRLGVDDGGFGRIPRGLSFCLRIIFCKKGSIEIHLIFILPLLQQKGGDK